jgi:N-(5-amino-5-carboxypentanoyl)-L-cysteinyl-D-valine synthase
VQPETGIALSVKHIFDYPTVRALIDHLPAPAPIAPQAPERLSGACPLLPIQRWFFAKPLVDRARWNQCFTIRTPALDMARLADALGKLIDYHDAFWLRFSVSTSGPAQHYADDRPAVVLHTLDVRGMANAELDGQLDAWQRGFDLEYGPTYSAAYLHGFADGSARIWFAIHHLIVDVVSWQIITQDLEILYHGGALGARHATFRAWAEAVQRYRPNADEQRLWARVARAVAAECADGELAVPRERVARRARFALTAAETRALLIDSAWAYDTEVSDLLLTALGYALHAVTGRAANYVTVEGHGRELLDGAPEVRDCVGWFTTMHPLRVEVEASPGRSVLTTKAHRRQVPHHGLGYGAVHGSYGDDRAPLPRVAFNYLGRLESRPGADDSAPAWRLDASTWAATARPDGEAASDSTLDVTMSCVDDELNVVIDSQLAEPTTERFTAALGSALRELIAHTAATARNGQRPAGGEEPGTFVPSIVVNDDAPGRRLFMLPPGEGGAESYLSNLARQLPGHRLVICNNRHLHAPSESFESLAEYYVEHIRGIQPVGPYHLLGWSFGGVLALEVASQLARAGERIAQLVLIDAYFDITRAVADSGLATATPLLDPINYRYRPDRAALAPLIEHAGTVLLFKAGEANDVVTSEDQRRLFSHYHRTRYNNLDTLLPDDRIRVEVMTGQTHHSWIRAPAVVEAMGRLIAGLLEAT